MLRGPSLRDGAHLLDLLANLGDSLGDELAFFMKNADFDGALAAAGGAAVGGAGALNRPRHFCRAQETQKITKPMRPVEFPSAFFRCLPLPAAAAVSCEQARAARRPKPHAINTTGDDPRRRGQLHAPEGCRDWSGRRWQRRAVHRRVLPRRGHSQ